MEEARKYDSLHNKDSGDYKNKYKKLNCWKRIGEKLAMTLKEPESKYKNIAKMDMDDTSKGQNQLDTIPVPKDSQI